MIITKGSQNYIPFKEKLRKQWGKSGNRYNYIYITLPRPANLDKFTKIFCISFGIVQVLLIIKKKLKIDRQFSDCY